LRNLRRLLSFEITYPVVYIEEIPGGHPIQGVPTTSNAEVTYPGVYLDEVPSVGHSIPGVPTSIGPALCAPLSFVEFRFKEAPRRRQGSTDVCCSVEASCGGFHGRVNSVWFKGDDIKRFLAELEELEARRKGSVCLVNHSSSSDENPLTFELKSVDSAGHLIVKATLLKPRHRNDELNPLVVSVSFAVDAGMLRSLVFDFRKLFAFRKGS